MPEFEMPGGPRSDAEAALEARAAFAGCEDL